MTIDEAARVLAKRAIQQAAVSATALKDTLSLTEDVANDAFSGFLFLCIHMAERAAMAKLSARRVKLFRRKLENAALALLHGYLDAPAHVRPSLLRKTAAALDRFHGEFQDFVPVPAQAGGELRGTLFYEFGKRIAQTASRPSDARVIAVATGQAVSAVKELDAPTIINALREST